MRDLLGKLTALDPEASEAFKVVGYFDALTARGVELGGLLRAAAALAGVVAGAQVRGRTVAYGPDGRKIPEAEVPETRTDRAAAGDPQRGSETVFAFGVVWLERQGAPHPCDAMITERLALAVEALESRRGASGQVEIVVDRDRSPVERATALARLGLDPSDQVRIIVGGTGRASQRGRTDLVTSPCGNLLTAIVPFDPSEVSGPAGIGTLVRADHAPDSWESALIAYRLIPHGSADVVDASELGVMLILARAYDPERAHPDVLVLTGLDDQSRQILQALVESDSLRSAATRLAMHHSTLQARHESLTRALGYDPRSTTGRMRYMSAEFLRRLSGPNGLGRRSGGSRQ